MKRKWKTKTPKKAIENYLKFCGGLTISENRKEKAKQTLNNIYGLKSKEDSNKTNN